MGIFQKAPVKSFFSIFSFKIIILISMLIEGSVFAKPVLNNEAVYTLLNPDSTLSELLEHPAFSGFSERLLPRREDKKQRELLLRDVGILMPYHSLFDANDMTNALNFLIKQASRDKPVFFDIYSKQHKQSMPQKSDTGLFFFKGKPGAPFAIIIPGGGFSYVGALHEGFPIAQVVAEQGYNAFVLTYRTGQGGRVATEDLAAAVSFLFKYHEKLEISPQAYSLWGASAGARMAAYIGSYGPDAFNGVIDDRPRCVVMLYTGHSDYTANEPATFVAVGEDDRIASPTVMKARIDALSRLGVPVEFHLYSGVGHGFALGTGSPAQGWVGNAIKFWQRVSE